MKPEQIASYRQQLLELESRLETEIEELSNEIASGGIAVGEHDTHVRESPEANLAISSNEEAIRRDVSAALKRIESDTFGKCVGCGETIKKARLEALPYTPFCIQCETIREAK